MKDKECMSHDRVKGSFSLSFLVEGTFSYALLYIMKR